ncbi:hypothetical protein [Streptomyces sp. DH12]|uniref:hypothetical protein n=1 Tax=Streptomyces sp. DH12 TaxID=2857010 RepID=UPI001E6183A0|nr:hypothetical protein [Streptomyces sp. DH12]
MSRLQRESLAKYPTPPTTPLEALAHVLAIYEDSPDDMVILTATRNIYPEAPFTGLRLGDLRRLLDDHAHELAEKIRSQPMAVGFEDGAWEAASLIDPEVTS